MNPENVTAVVVGGSRGLGRGIVEALRSRRMRVIVVAREASQLASLAAELPGIETIAADASEEIAAARVRMTVQPDVLVLCAGASPILRPLHLHTWETFSINWEVDAKMAFVWLRDQLLLPARPGAHVVVVSSGAAERGSPLSGGYAGAKRTQWFLAEYAAAEAKRLGVDLRMHCLLPQLNPSTELGKAAIAAYAERAGIQPGDFEQRFGPPLTPSILGQAVLSLVTEPEKWPDLAYRVSGSGLAALRETGHN